MLSLNHSVLSFSMPEVHPNANFHLTLMRTLRIPDDDKEYPLPPGMGTFSPRHMEDFKGKVPAKWSKRGGVLIPMYQSEAMWLRFSNHGYPIAIKVAAGKVSALTGKKWKDKLRKKDYMVNSQRWLDGYVVEDGTIRQFVAEPLGSGMTAEGQITGVEEFGGIQIEVFPLKKEVYEKKLAAQKKKRDAFLKRSRKNRETITRGMGPNNIGPYSSYRAPGVYSSVVLDSMDANPPVAIAGGVKTLEMSYSAAAGDDCSRGVEIASAAGLDSLDEINEVDSIQDMGLAAGGRMRQQVFEDTEFSPSDYDMENGERVFIHIVNSMVWNQITGENPPHPPLTATSYAEHKYPWFDLWDKEAKALKGTKKTSSLKSVAEMEKIKKVKVLPENKSLPNVSKLIPQKNAVVDGKW